MTSNKKLVLMRLEKQEKKLREDPLEQAWVAREGVLNFHFCLHNLDHPYTDGFYHGVLQLSQDYPFSPPTLIFYTPSGRFETNKQICTTFTNFHKQTWTSSWNVRTMILGTISFMQSEAQGSVGSVKKSSSQRKRLALESMEFNLNNQLFKQVFHKQIISVRYNRAIQKTQGTNQNSSMLRGGIESQSSNKYTLYCLYALIILVVLLWVSLKETNITTF